MSDLPEATKTPCNECPWRRTAQVGHLGPHTAEHWAEGAHSEAPIACHKTIRGSEAEWDTTGVKQCRGAAIFRANVFKLPRDPEIVTGPADHDAVFSSNEEFINHHKGNA